MTFFRKHTGKMGEDAAVKQLKKVGLRIVSRNYSCKLGEIDIIARDGSVLVFVEVRSRRTAGYGLPQETIGFKKMAKVRQIAQYYLMVNKIKDVACRFDVVAVQLNGDGAVKNLEHIQNAF
ncbi:MAG: YraN family protein [Desulfotomaculum sp.]|nr:YraN family protein [Desulfotomaculum sp.]